MLKYISIFFVLLASFSCEHKDHDHHKAEKIERNLKLEATITQGSLQVTRALKSSVGEAVRESRLALVKNPPKRSNYLKEGTNILSLAFSANIHGERIDCGCRKNPLGGLARHQTMIEEVAKAGPNWTLPPNENLLSLDAGDVFFKNVFDNVVEEKGETPAIYHAKSIASARKLMQLDVQNIGELDLVFGLQTLQELIQIMGKKAVSANLYKDGKRIFNPFEIIEKGGKKIAVIGLTKEKSRKNGFYKSRALEVRDPLKEYESVRASLPKVDLVIVLSNLGLPNTRKLISKSSSLPDLVLISNTNRMTKEPKFERGVPMIEPGSRGKYFGRADLILNGEKVEFANGGETQLSKLDAFSRTYRNYLSARIRYLRQIEKAQRSELGGDHAVEEKHDHMHSPATHEHKKDPKKFMKNAAVLQKQMATLAETLAGQSRVLNAKKSSKGDDFVEVQIAPVKLDVVEKKIIKALISKREKVAPKVKKAQLPKR